MSRATTLLARPRPWSPGSRLARWATELATSLAAIEEITAPGAGLLTVLDLLDTHLPDELWVTAARTLRAAQPDFGWEGARPFVVIEGSGKEQDRDLASAVVELTTRLRGHEAVAGVVMTYNTDNRGRFFFELRIDTSVRPGGDVDDEPADDEEAA